ncbi:hypothetical protein [Deinococcus enclensis]|uniref:Uncharacterized protein n=1 Tax=Deinococcus enclensis TaxID=1049582 RepID=A0ABT9MG64_9DEIO|nr:hypothetical protein [Deinococcus enclensis]MDP9765550.1 hypothetical protein [Deinococcus enclensis]
MTTLTSALPGTPVTFTPHSAGERQVLKEHGPAWTVMQASTGEPS